MLVLLSLIACTDVVKNTDDTVSGGIEVTAASSGVDTSVDATPTADGSDIWFVTDGAASQLYEVTEDGPEARASFSAARGVVASADGSFYVADEDAGIYSVSAAGTSTLVSGTEGYAPTALDLPSDLYFTGTLDGDHGLFTVPTSGGTPTAVVGGFTDVLEGVVVADDGGIYVAGGSAVYEVTDGVATVIADGVTLGSPAGISLTPDDAAVMVSSLSAEGTAAVLIIDRETLDQSVFDDVISANTSAGGLHRARDNSSVYAWADLTSTGTGTVYRVNFY